jgi:hypothetical protein
LIKYIGNKKHNDIFCGKYSNPFTGYGFKKLFGEKPNKDLFFDFLNELLKKNKNNLKT